MEGCRRGSDVVLIWLRKGLQLAAMDNDGAWAVVQEARSGLAIRRTIRSDQKGWRSGLLGACADGERKSECSEQFGGQKDEGVDGLVDWHQWRFPLSAFERSSAIRQEEERGREKTEDRRHRRVRMAGRMGPGETDSLLDRRGESR